jgi:hypothetical protein
MTKRMTLASLCLIMAGFAKAESFLTFDVPGAVQTFPIGILQGGEIVGYWADANKNQHGFVRSKRGEFTSFDPAGSLSTSVTGFNAAGTISGSFTDAAGVVHGYLRFRGGEFTTFDHPDAAQEPEKGTFACKVNPSVTISGYYVDKDKVAHGFTGSPGNFTTFDAPGGTSTFTATVDALNPAGDAVGGFPDSNGVNHGFVRSAAGALTQIDGPGQVNTFIT